MDSDAQARMMGAVSKFYLRPYENEDGEIASALSNLFRASQGCLASSRHGLEEVLDILSIRRIGFER
jgi:hypothetical protein